MQWMGEMLGKCFTVVCKEEYESDGLCCSIIYFDSV